MRAILVIVLAATAMTAGCGGDGSTGSSIHHDAGNPDASGFPPPPTLGAQLDRAGRAAVGTLLVGTFAAEPSRTAIKDAYDRASDAATWATTMLPNNVTIEKELETNLAAFDAIDVGMNPPVSREGCGNALSYNPPTGPTSYQVAADIFADDQLYVDTSKATCNVYFSLEIEFASATGAPHTSCGGRTPQHDVIDAMYSSLAAGISGVDLLNDLAPKLHDNTVAHGDVKETFPFLGPPH